MKINCYFNEITLMNRNSNLKIWTTFILREFLKKIVISRLIYGTVSVY